MSTTQSTAGTLATAAAGLFAGSALFISAVEQPALLEVDPSGKLAAQRFGAMYKRAAPLQGALALVGSAAAITAAAQGGHCSRVLWGGSGALLLSVWPYTLLAMMPTNKKLINKEGSEEERAELAQKWGRLHLYRTAAGLASFTAMALALARLEHKSG
ncbi:hypothetical protein Rsub_10257 [Raphidocelis subcapitata]|uniref:DUF1772 domain-containing protein n=1 Tax=Raphidocelis subcapitata TaxID=307507 RepID=A0A2V0PFW5_9CHLO|nr:hypothetical protein Rsub_10257 [Raphidocelis subcapitata]|eukprot:GBF97902.1 hypothetical protein Rsub_10257 [Raphidocelis subcapitata]